MAITHIAEEPITAGTKGGLLLGDKVNILADADLTTLAAAKTAVDTASANLHVAERTFAPRVKASLDMVGNYDSTYIAGGDVDKATMLAISNAGEGRSLSF